MFAECKLYELFKLKLTTFNCGVTLPNVAILIIIETHSIVFYLALLFTATMS